MKSITPPLLCLLSLLSASFIYAQSTAKYSIDVTTVWNDADHGPLPGNAHWSNLVGVTHNSDVVFWELGTLASNGIEDVAEIGNNDDFNTEVNAAITNGDADQWLQEPFSPFAAISNSNIPEVIVSSDFPLLTLASMIAPSPDWFIGVNSLSLRDGSNNWKTSVVLDLFVYDAGTEEGNGYSMSNPDTNPHIPISSKINVSPFNDQKVATLTVSLVEVLSTNDLSFSESFVISPNPVRESINIYNNSSSLITEIGLFDLLGNLVFSFNPGSQVSGIISIPRRNLSDGIYLINIIGNDGARVSKKLILN